MLIIVKLIAIKVLPMLLWVSLHLLLACSIYVDGNQLLLGGGKVLQVRHQVLTNLLPYIHQQKHDLRSQKAWDPWTFPAAFALQLTENLLQVSEVSCNLSFAGDLHLHDMTAVSKSKLSSIMHPPLLMRSLCSGCMNSAIAQLRFTSPLESSALEEAAENVHEGLTALRTSAELCWKAFTSAGMSGPCSAASASALPMPLTSTPQHASSTCMRAEHPFLPMWLPPL